jgi:hypothetical protein
LVFRIYHHSLSLFGSRGLTPRKGRKCSENQKTPRNYEKKRNSLKIKKMRGNQEKLNKCTLTIADLHQQFKIRKYFTKIA